MQHHYSTYYELDRKLREKEVARDIEQKYWVEQATRRGRPRRLHRLRSLAAIIIGFFIQV